MIEGVSLDAGGKQCVPDQQQISVLGFQCIGDVGEEFECQFRVQQGISLTCTRASAGSWYCLTR